MAAPHGHPSMGMALPICSLALVDRSSVRIDGHCGTSRPYITHTCNFSAHGNGSVRYQDSHISILTMKFTEI